MPSQIPGVTRKDRTNSGRPGLSTSTVGTETSPSGEEGARTMLGSSPEFRAMMTQIILECVEPQLEGIHTDLQQLRVDLNVLRGEVEQKCSGSCLQEVARLDKDVLALRDFTQKNSDAIWKEMAHITEQIPKRDVPPQIKEEEDPVRDDAVADRRSPLGGMRSRTPSPNPVRRSRSGRRSGRKKSAWRSRRRDNWSDESDAWISFDESDTGSEGEGEGIRVAERHCRKAIPSKRIVSTIFPPKGDGRTPLSYLKVVSIFSQGIDLMCRTPSLCSTF